MFRNLNNEAFDMLSKIMFRSAKNLGIYSILKQTIKKKGFRTIKGLFLGIYKTADIISNGVVTYWQLIFDETRRGILSSFFLITVITDERIFSVDECSNKTWNYDKKCTLKKIRRQIDSEIEFLSKRSIEDWKFYSSQEEIETFIELIKEKKGYFNIGKYEVLINMLKDKLKLFNDKT